MDGEDEGRAIWLCLFCLPDTANVILRLYFFNSKEVNSQS